MNSQLEQQVKAELKTAALNLEFTRVKASVDGYVTNLNLRLGSQAVANQSALALVDTNSFWVHGFFRETLVGRLRPVVGLAQPCASAGGARDDTARRRVEPVIYCKGDHHVH